VVTRRHKPRRITPHPAPPAAPFPRLNRRRSSPNQPKAKIKNSKKMTNAEHEAPRSNQLSPTRSGGNRAADAADRAGEGSARGGVTSSSSESNGRKREDWGCFAPRELTTRLFQLTSERVVVNGTGEEAGLGCRLPVVTCRTAVSLSPARGVDLDRLTWFSKRLPAAEREGELGTQNGTDGRGGGVAVLY
jgi:hypothetical protein